MEFNQKSGSRTGLCKTGDKSNHMGIWMCEWSMDINGIFSGNSSGYSMGLCGLCWIQGLHMQCLVILLGELMARWCSQPWDLRVPMFRQTHIYTGVELIQRLCNQQNIGYGKLITHMLDACIHVHSCAFFLHFASFCAQQGMRTPVQAFFGGPTDQEILKDGQTSENSTTGGTSFLIFSRVMTTTHIPV